MEGTTQQVKATRLLFAYVNHRGSTHTYLVEPRGIKFGVIKQGERPRWLLQADVIERDGEEILEDRRFRSFDLMAIGPGEEVEP